MLSVGKLTPGQVDYYIEQLPAGADEYYLKSEREGEARWLGQAAQRLGLDGEATADAFRLLLDARHPVTANHSAFRTPPTPGWPASTCVSQLPSQSAWPGPGLAGNSRGGRRCPRAGGHRGHCRPRG